MTPRGTPTPMPILAPVLSELSVSLVGNDADDGGADVVEDGDTGVVADVDKVDEVSKEMVVGAGSCQYRRTASSNRGQRLTSSSLDQGQPDLAALEDISL